MGKKGRQSGTYGSKRNRALHLQEIQHRHQLYCDHENEDEQIIRTRYASPFSSGFKMDHNPNMSQQYVIENKNTIASHQGMETHRNTKRNHDTCTQDRDHSYTHDSHRPTVRLNPLRCLIQERLMEDRQRNRDSLFHPNRNQNHHQQYNSTLRNHRSSSTSSLLSRDYCGTPHIPMNRMPRHETGWLLSYHPRYFFCHGDSHTTQDSTIDSNGTANRSLTLPLHLDPIKQSSSTHRIPTLQMLSARVFGHVLHDYIHVMGRDSIHLILQSLPAEIIAEISVFCQEMYTSNDTVFVLGCHPHVTHLVIQEPTMGHDGSRKHHEITDEAIRMILPSLYWNHDGSANMPLITRNTSHSLLDHSLSSSSSYNMIQERLDETTLSTWEDLQEDSLDQSLQLYGCWNLLRLELVNITTLSVKSLIQLFTKCPRITHLSLSGSMDCVTGPELLLYYPYVNTNHPMTDDSTMDDWTLLSVLSHLQVLDVSHCKWMTMDVLRLFLSRISFHRKRDEMSDFTLLCVAGCTPDWTEEQCREWNKRTHHRPEISLQRFERTSPGT